MYHTLKYLFHTLLLSTYILSVLAVRGGHHESDGSREWRAVRAARRRSANPSVVEVQGLDILKTYVCPASANAIKRQIEVKSGTTTVSVPLSELESLYHELESVLIQLAAILAQYGVTPPSSILTMASLSVAGPSNIISIPAITALPGLPTTGNDMMLVVTNSQVLEEPVIPAATTGAGMAGTSSGIATPAALIPNVQQIVTVTVTQFTTVTYTPPVVDLPATAASSTKPATQPATQPAIQPATQPATQPAAGPATEPATGPIMGPVGISLTSPTAYSNINIIIKVSSTPTTTSIDVSSSTESVCWDDETTLPLIYRPGATITANVAAIDTTTAASVAATGTTNPRGGVFLQSPIIPSISAAPNGYTFKSQSRNNVAVYFGQTPVTAGSSLVAQCADPNIDIVILSFIIGSRYQGTRYPQINFGAACGGQTDEMKAVAPGLLSCPDLAGMISSCQNTYGKKVLLSIGGATSTMVFTESSQASEFANVVWQLFGPPGSIDVALRPFGTVAVDGFDIDNENHRPDYYDVFGKSLKTNFATDTSKEYYLSSAPQCPFPDASNPEALILLCDFVFVHFYNNPPCEIGSKEFSASISQWSSFLERSTLAAKPRLYVGAPAWSEAGPTAYANIGTAHGMEAVAKNLTSVPNLGGISLWDGPEGMLNLADGKDIISWAKMGLTS